MGISIILGLLSTRIILNTLGENDYGTYTVVGSFVSMFTILNSILQSGTRLFLALNIGKPKEINLTLLIDGAPFNVYKTKQES